MGFLKDFKDRSKSTTPPFFKKVEKIGNYVLVAGVLAGSALGSLATAGVTIPIWATIAVSVITGLGYGARKVATLATEDQELIDKQYKKEETAG